MVAQVVFREPLDFYLPVLLRRYPKLGQFYSSGKLYLDIRTMHHPLPIQVMHDSPDSEFALLIGERKNYIFTTRLDLRAITPAYGYVSPLEKVAEKEILQVRKELGGNKKVALYIEKEFKGMI